METFPPQISPPEKGQQMILRTLDNDFHNLTFYSQFRVEQSDLSTGNWAIEAYCPHDQSWHPLHVGDSKESELNLLEYLLSCFSTSKKGIDLSILIQVLEEQGGKTR
ncbi:MAG: hypothetical protein J7524_10640 [Roseofilum sp. Belize BBD 4]|uniref:hypothetical protein n=1 Tax=Roseofilum sp. Belize BBD 4 TaxID=2821500 RepID=UPI001B09461A|nr:hypothetical protein [Roseofilum sp. Belize BBD 4]MBP0033610.1 hypothetical protein [Roseofilum sp. Belize BBD 4]